MLISCNKLKSYIKNSEDIDWLKIWDEFTVKTAEVEDVKEVGKSFDGVIVAEIKSCEEHPDSDHMHILQLDIGKKDLLQVVCGAPNVKVGLKTALVQVGGHIDGFEITARPLRGIQSNGMCCSGKELSISDNHDGILELPNDWENGKDIKEYLPIEDIIVEIDNKSLTNRPDLWGHYGIAREIATITEHELKSLNVQSIENNKNDLDIIISNPELCYRYCGLTIDNIKNNKTPLDMQIFLYYVGMRSISLIVDLTNYVMLELGQPMHAFDSKAVKNIKVGKGKSGDIFTTLDNVERKLTDDMLMIKNDKDYFAVAGVMGGLDSEIEDNTDALFLESATFNAGSIRKTAVALGLRTEASARYEKSLDPNLAPTAIERFVYLLKMSNPDLEITSNLTDVYPTKLEEGNIKLTKNKLNKYIGYDFDEEKTLQILNNLGFKVINEKDYYDVTIPTFRHSKDISIEEDLIEEITRINGLEKLTATPLKLDLISNKLDTIFDQEYDVKKLLATKYDMNEVHSYMWYDSALLKELNIDKDGVKLIGKTENNVLRDDLSFSLLNIVKENFKNYNSFNIFEIGTTIINNENKRFLSIILANEENKLEENYNKAKEIVSYIFSYLKNKKIKFNKYYNEKDYYSKDLSKEIIIDDQYVGMLNVLKNNILNKISKKKSLVCVDIDFDKFAEIKSEDLLAKEVSKYPTVELDYTIILSSNIKYEVLDNLLENFKSNLIKDYYLVGIYENKYTIRYILGSNTKTLESKDLQTFKDRFIKYIEDNNLEIIK